MTENTKSINTSLNTCELTILMPCLNEAETLAVCINKAKNYLQNNNIIGEILIADNGSTDGSQEIAQTLGVSVINVKERGYGSALMGGINSSNGMYIIMGDADDSYDFSSLDLFIEKLKSGCDLVMGNRFKGGIKRGAMPFLHKYLGNPVLSGIGRLFFRCPLGDFHCGLRGFNKQSIQTLNLQSTGMEFASEMVVKAAINKLDITEVPTILHPDGRNRPPHLRTWRDGWRHLRFLLMFSPRWLFFYPGIILLLLGLASMLILATGPKNIYGITFDIHTMLYAAMCIILGVQVVSFSLFTKIFAINLKLFPEKEIITKLLDIFTLEKGLIIGGLVTLIGFIGSIYSVFSWSEHSFGNLVPSSMMRLVIPFVTCIVVGIQVAFSSFFLSILQIKHK